MAETVTECLRRAMQRDTEKGYASPGFRNTREVADWLGASLASTRRQLWAAVERDEVEAFDGGGEIGGALTWRVMPWRLSNLKDPQND